MDENYRRLTSSITDPFYALDKNLRFTFWNKGSETLTGIPSPDIIGKSLYEVFPEVKGSKAEEAYLKVLSTKTSRRIVNEYNLNGDIRFFDLSIYPDGEGITVISRDITDIYNHTEDIRSAEETFRSTLDNMLEGCAIFSKEWKYLYANDVHKKHAHIGNIDVTGKYLLDLVPGVEKSKFFKAYLISMEQRIPKQIEDYFTFRGGETFWYEARSFPVPEGIFVLSIDITDRKKQEQELSRYQSILTQTEKMAHLGSWWIDLANIENININKLNWSAEVFRIFGYEPYSVEVTNDLFFSHVHPDDKDQIRKDVNEAIAEGRPYDLEHRIICVDGTEKIVHEYANIIFDDNGSPSRIIGAVNDITKLRNAVKERDLLLKQIEQDKSKLETIIESVPVEIWVFDNNGSLLFVNQAVKSGLGFDDINSLSLDSVLTSLEIRHLDGSIRKPEESALYRSLKGEEVTGDEMVRHLKTGEYCYRHFFSTPIKDKNGFISGVVVVVNDITHHKKSEEKILELLRVSELRSAEMNAIIESMPDAVYIGSKEGMTIANTNALKMLGAKSLEDLQQRVGELAEKFNVRWPDTGIPLTEDELQFTRALNGEIITEEVLATNAETGEDIYIRSACAPIKQNGVIIGAVAINSDITERVKTERLIKNSLKEKEVLLRELYHRTKNNMQVISSILGLKAASVDNALTAEILEEMKNRILSIALVHQKLYQSRNLSRVDLKEYITDLIKLLDSSYSINPEQVKIELELENINVLIDTAIPCGLIINELVSNSLKYGFPSGNTGIIKICLAKHENGVIELLVQDNGIGISREQLEDSHKLGLQLVKIIAQDQLQAEIEVDTSSGVKWEIRFKDVLYDERI